MPNRTNIWFVRESRSRWCFTSMPSRINQLILNKFFLPSQELGMSASRSRGFTLIELMVTLAVAAILLTIGVPSFRDLMIKSRLSGQVQEFYGALGYARSEAIKRGNYVSICKSADGSSCGDNTVSWSNGWIVFANNDNDSPAVRDISPNEEPLLRVFPALPSNYTLNANSFTNYITYDRFGMANTNGTFVFCANSDESKARAIAVITTRPRIATDTDGDGIPNTKSDGSNLTSCENP